MNLIDFCIVYKNDMPFKNGFIVAFWRYQLLFKILKWAFEHASQLSFFNS